MSSRLSALQSRMRREGIAAVAVTDLRNVRYLTGFTGSAGSCLITGRGAMFFTDFRYRAQSSRQVDKAFRRVEHRFPLQGVAEEACRLRLKELAFEEEHLAYSLYRRLKQWTKGVRLRPVCELVEHLRLRKDASELRLLRRGARINGEALVETTRAMRSGMREDEVAFALEAAMRRLGASRPAFDTIVASGARSALPHGTASKKIVRRGDLVTIDFGAVVEGYHADTTRVFCLGKPSSKAREIYDIVLRAQVKAVETVAPGVSCGEVDAAARELIAREGYGEAFGHGTGHGVGLDIHEGPRLGPGAKEVLEPGMVVTVEPGIYLAGWGGVRIEDMVLVTEKGREVLTRTISKDLVLL